MKFPLCSGTKNSFIFIAEENFGAPDYPLSLRNLSRSELARRACNQLGSGADGLVIVKTATADSGYDFEWDFFNKDGSSAEMCGNASRCMGFYVYKYLGCEKPEVRFKSLAGVIQVKRLGESLYSVKMPNHQIDRLWEREIVNGEEVSFCAFNTGVPHAVIEVDDLEPQRLMPLVRHFRFHPCFGPAGANVSFFTDRPEGFQGVTFERGVEGFTASCGTGVVALGLAIFQSPQRNNLEHSLMGQKSVEIKTPGGFLRVELDSSEKFCWLIGPAGLDEEIEVY